MQFEDSGEMSVTGTTATVSPLIPGTRYHFKVSAISPVGRGAERSVFSSTQIYSGKVHIDIILYAYKCRLHTEVN